VAKRYRPVVRDQEFLLPPNMADWLPPDHLVWFILDVVEQLDTRAFHRRGRRGGVGRQGYDPDMLLALLLYAYAVGERSSRRIERLCQDHVAFRVLCGQDAPDHTTLARFRAAHEDAFAGLFAQVLRLSAQAGMVRVGVVAIDGTKIAADAARTANRTPRWLRAEAERVAREILTEAGQVDDAEDTAAAVGSGPDDRLPPGMADRRSRAANINKALAELDRQDTADRAADQVEQRRLADYLARVEAGEVVPGAPPAGIDMVAYHRARAARERRRIAQAHGLRGHAANRQRAEARRQLKKILDSIAEAERAAAAGQVDPRGAKQRLRDRRDAAIRTRGGAGRTVNLTDPDSRLMTTANGGSVQGYNAQVAVTDEHLILGIHLSQDANDLRCFAPTLAAAQTAVTSLKLSIGTVLADAGYFTNDNLTLPGPDRLIAPGKHRELFDEVNDHPASGPPPADATPQEAMRHRLRTPEGTELYKRRSATVETVIAHLKELTGLTKFSRRGLPAVTAELHLAAAVHNLRRMHTAAPQPC
jgi:transposase